MREGARPHTQQLPDTQGPTPGTCWGGGGGEAVAQHLPLCPFSSFPSPGPDPQVPSSPPHPLVAALLLLRDCLCPVLSYLHSLLLCSLSLLLLILSQQGAETTRCLKQVMGQSEREPPKMRRRGQENCISSDRNNQRATRALNLS